MTERSSTDSNEDTALSNRFEGFVSDEDEFNSSASGSERADEEKTLLLDPPERPTNILRPDLEGLPPPEWKPTRVKEES